MNEEGRGGVTFGAPPQIRMARHPSYYSDRRDDAYGVESEQILGAPQWANSDRYDIKAKFTESEANKVKKLEEDSSTREYNRALQQLIAERFNLVLHQETKLLPAYVLRVTSNGPKLHPATPG